MPEIRASRIGSEYDPDGADPILVIRDEHGVLRPIVSVKLTRDSFVRGNLKGYDSVLILEVEQ